MDITRAILDRYSNYFDKYQSIGCIAVSHSEDGGGWELFHKARAKKDEGLIFNQEFYKLAMKDF